jgi:Xaa-Pro aminopeptidase
MHTELAFPVDVYKKRLTRLRQRMAERGCDAVLYFSPENLFYLTGYNTVGQYYGYQCVVVPVERDPFFIVRRVEESNVLARSWIHRRYVYTDYDDPVEVTVRALQSEGLARGTLGINPNTRSVTPTQYNRLVHGCAEASIFDSFGLLERIRIVKDPEEIECIRQGCRIAEAGMKAGVEAVRVNAREEEVAAEVYRAMILAGGEYPGMPAFITSGWRSGLGHSTWEGHRRIEAGDVVHLEVPGVVKRYHGVFNRCLVVGPPKDDLRRYVDVVLATREAGLNAIREGVSASDVDQTMKQVVAKAGLGDHYLHRAGYGLGVAYPPRWDEGHILSLRNGEQTVLQENMVFHMLPVLYFYQEACIAITETVRVTKTGCEAMTRFPAELIVV